MTTLNIVNILFFQLGWFACIFGGNLLAVLSTATILILHQYLFIKDKREWRVVLIFSTVGITIDSVLIGFGLLETHWLLCPPWLMCLWVLLSLTLNHSLKWMQAHFYLAAIASAICAPWTYWVGSQFVEIKIAYFPLSLIVVSLVWAVWFPAGLMLAKNLKPVLTALMFIGLTNTFFYVPAAKADIEDINDKKFDVIGTAYGINEGKILYREMHSQLGQYGRQVYYVTPLGKVIAKKHIDYSTSTIGPSFIQKNYWANEMVSAHLKQYTLHLSYGQLSQEKNDESRFNDISVKEKTILVNQVVIDAGFDNFIRENWQTLTSGKKIEYMFAVASRLTVLNMRLQESICKNKLDEIDYGETFCLTTEPSNFLFRLLTSPIELTYHRKTRKLLRFFGLGNIADKQGNFINVDIRYTYI